jgi:hypothetical protein
VGVLVSLNFEQHKVEAARQGTGNE